MRFYSNIAMLTAFTMAGITLTACSHKSTTHSELTPVQKTTSVTIPGLTKVGSETATTENMNTDKQTNCEYEKDKRTLRIAAVQPKGCDLWYSNFSKENAVASSRISLNHCQNVHDKIVDKLTTAGFKCDSPAKSDSTSVTTTQAIGPLPEQKK